MDQTVKLGGVFVFALCGVLTLEAPARAQGVAGGLFGATRADAAGNDKLNLQMAMAEALDSEVPPEFRALAPGNDLLFGRRSTMLAASADYARNGRSVQLFGDASTYLRYNQRLDRIAAGSQSAQLGAGLSLPKQGSLRITQAAAYSPSYLYDVFPSTETPGFEEAIPVKPEYRIDQKESYSYRTRMTIAFGSARGVRLTTTAEYGLADFQNSTAHSDLTTYAAGANVSRALSRTAAVSVGYKHSTHEYSSGALVFGAPTKAHRVTLGVEYSPALSVSRRATFRLEVSPAMLEIAESPVADMATHPIAVTIDEPGPSAVEWRVYPLHGQVTVEYPFRLKWRASASYRRGVEHMAVLSQPVFSNGARINLTGVIGRRVDVSASAGYAKADSTLPRSTRILETYTGEARIRYALTRYFALYSEYLYYYFNLGGDAHLAAGLPEVYEQRGIRAGIMIFSQPIGN